MAKQKSYSARLKEHEVRALNLPIKEPEFPGRKTYKYNLGKKNIRKLYELRGYDKPLIDYCIEHRVSPSKATLYWHKPDKKMSVMSRVPELPWVEQVDGILDEAMEKWSGIIKPRSFDRFLVKDQMACNVVLSDSHVGMNPSPKGSGLFKYEYDSMIYKQKMTSVTHKILGKFKTYGGFDVLYIDDLGDLADGWNGQTTRGGHELPQNLTEDEVFDIVLDSKLDMITQLMEHRVANQIIIRVVTNDNHAGKFALMLAKALKRCINLLYKTDVCDVDILRDFFEHRSYGDHGWLLSHGKDQEYMNRGLPLSLNDRTINFINEYIDHYEIKDKFLHVHKGDLHRVGYERTKKFDYRNFMSFAPPSSWIQHNFGDSYSGYSIQVVPKHINEIDHSDYFLEYLKMK
jgi:hypothetical protein